MRSKAAVALVGLLVLVLLVVKCTGEKEPPPKPRPPDPDPIPLTEVTWGRLRFPLPVAWKDNPRNAADGRQIVFDGPRDAGEPTVSLFWVESRRDVDGWAEFMRKKYDNAQSPGIVVQKGWSTVGGKRAFFMVYEMARDKPIPGMDDTTHITIDWYFQHDGHVGFLRCTSLKKYFPSDYRPLFESIAARLQFLPSPR